MYEQRKSRKSCNISPLTPYLKRRRSRREKSRKYFLSISFTTICVSVNLKRNSTETVASIVCRFFFEKTSSWETVDCITFPTKRRVIELANSQAILLCMTILKKFYRHDNVFESVWGTRGTLSDLIINCLLLTFREF